MNDWEQPACGEHGDTFQRNTFAVRGFRVSINTFAAVLFFARVLARHIITRCYLSGFSFPGERSEFSGRHFLDAPSRARRPFLLGHTGPLMVKIPSVLGKQCRALNAVLPVSHVFLSIFEQSRASESVPRLPSFDSTFQLQNKKSILLCLIGSLCF